MRRTKFFCCAVGGRVEAQQKCPPIANVGVYCLAAGACYPIASRGTMAGSVTKPEDCGPYADRRVYPRVPVALAAFLQANGDRHAVQLLDISPAGAKLDCAASLAVGTAVTLDCGTLCRTAVVRWQSGGLLGLCFDRELDAREASALIERAKALAARMEIRE